MTDPKAWEGHTPGPWRWEVNITSKRVQLCGGPPKSGFGKYDLTVMSFARWGLQSAAPVFWDWEYDKCVGEPHRADTIAEPVEGREHHKDWFRSIPHPDAALIAAAPDLAAEVARLTAERNALAEDRERIMRELWKLREFVKMLASLTVSPEWTDDQPLYQATTFTNIKTDITAGDVHRARAALEGRS